VLYGLLDCFLAIAPRNDGCFQLWRFAAVTLLAKCHRED